MIDYEQLAKAAFDHTYSGFSQTKRDEWWETKPLERAAYTAVARAVVAALGDQGLCVVRREIVEMARTGLSFQEDKHGDLIFRREIAEIDAALAVTDEQEQK